ncbi:hypothetical protein COU94_03905 [Candidatus Shapirobacteria bacterium CG10_big_fil_rev_8_21_14_0_10_38_8]|nr:MAG: hypothetical protein COU94_03905 [Candidatus Shapirobacteria bacterium CG10_big_fil_rev_8_21_14_0_10_38_8]
MVVAVILLNRSTGEIINDPEIISRGFVYVKDSEELLNQARRQIRLILKNAQNRRVGLRILREDIQASLEKMFLTKTGRRPMVLSQIIEV